MRPLAESDAAWVVEYFGDDYLRLYQFPPERTEPEVAFLTARYAERLSSGARVLDLACGQGRHAVPLAAQGYDVVGLDYQANLLEVAECRAREAGVQVPFVRGDMRALPFDDASFDAVQMIFTAFGYFSDAENAQVLAEVARVLRPGGWFVLDVANRDAMLRTAQPRSWKRLPDGTLVISEWTWDVPSGRYTHWQRLAGEDGTREYTHSVRVYTCTELATMLAGVGLSIVEMHGGFRGEALTLEAPRLLLLARKADETC